jgi:hypothetical protein
LGWVWVGKGLAIFGTDLGEETREGGRGAEFAVKPNEGEGVSEGEGEERCGHMRKVDFPRSETR